MHRDKTIQERYAEAAREVAATMGSDALTDEGRREDSRVIRSICEEEYAALAAEHEAYVTPQPLDDWHDDDGFALWHKFPIVEPPYCGSPLCDDWPGYHTHWTKIPVPTQPPSTKETTP